MPTNSGKNLFNVKEYVELEKDLFATGTYELTDEGHLQVNRTDSRVWERSSFEYKLYLKPDTDYTFSSGKGMNWRIYAFNKNGRTETIQSKGNIVSFKTSGNIEFITMKFFPQDMNYPVIVPYLQLEEGSVATEYEEYVPPAPTPEGHIFDLNGKTIYVGNQEIDRVYLGKKLLKGKLTVGYDDKPGFDFLPSTSEVYHTDFKSPDTDKTFITSGFDESSGVYQKDGFLFNSGLENHITFSPAKEPAVGTNVMVDINVSISNAAIYNSDHLFEARLGDTIKLDVYNDYTSRKIKVVLWMKDFRGDFNVTKYIPHKIGGGQHVNLILYGTHRRGYSYRGVYVEGEKLGDRGGSASSSLSNFQLITHNTNISNKNPLLYEVTLLQSEFTDSSWDEHMDNIYKRASNYYK